MRVVVSDTLDVNRIQVENTDPVTQVAVQDATKFDKITVTETGPAIAITLSATAFGVSSVNGVTGSVELTTDAIPEGTNKYYTDARVDAKIAAIDFPVDSVNGRTNVVTLTTTDIPEGSNEYFTTARANSAIDARLATKTTSNIAEGSNLYYTSARANSDFDIRLAAKSTSNLAEGSNLYYTDTRVNNVLSTKGYATTSYVDTKVSDLVNSAPATLDTLNELALALGDDPNFATTIASQIGTKFNTADFGTTFDTRLATKNTNNIAEGNLNKYYTDTRARAAISATGSLSYNAVSGVISYTTPTTIASLSNHTTTDLAEGTNLYYTTARANADFDARLATKSTKDVPEYGQQPGSLNYYFTNSRARAAISVSGSLSYNSSTGVISYTTPTTIASLSNHTTSDLIEGTNLYYTTVRANQDFDARLAAKSADDLIEGVTNKYYTDAKVRSAISATGNLSYNATTGQFSYTTPTTIASLSNHTTTDLAEGTNLYYTDARADAQTQTTILNNYAAKFSNAEITGALTVDNTASGVYLNVANVQVGDGAQTGLQGITLVSGTTAGYVAKDSVSNKLKFSNDATNWYNFAANTSDLAEGTNLYYTTARANADFDTRLATKSTTNLAEGTNLYYTNARARAAISAATGVTYDSNTGAISIGQSVGTSDNVTFQDAAIGRRSYIGAVRDTTTNTNGDVWSFGAGATGYRGYFVDNSANTAKRPGLGLRSYSGGASNPRSAFIYETSRGTAAAPTALQYADFLGEFIGTGRTSTGWVSDLVTAAPAGFTFYATENYTALTNVGAGWLLSLQPSGTTLTAGGASRITVIDANPQAMALRADAITLSTGKTTSFVATGCSVSGTTLTIGTVISGTVAVGAVVQTAGLNFQGAYIVANISGSGNGSTWTLSSSQTTASALTVFGNKGSIGVPSGAATVDVLQPLQVLSGSITVKSGAATVASINTTKAQFNSPVQLPSYTAAGLRAITGAIGWMAAVSDAGGKIAYWDTTNSRWSYISDNSAV